MSAILSIPPADYHRDELGDRPSLSASIANVLVSRSPLHAWTAHPRLNPDFARTEEQKFDIGTMAHAILLEGNDGAVKLCNFPDWRTSAAKEARDEARAEGRIPMLLKHFGEVKTMVEAARIQLEAINARPPLFTEGLPEQTLTWEEPNGVLCRARLDWLRDDRTAIDDLKTTSRSANPETWARTLFNIGSDLQAAFYLRGLKAVTGVAAEFRWAIVETAPPYAVSVLAPTPGMLDLATDKLNYAIRRWGECLESNVWPAYSSEVCYAELPGWMESQWLEREEREAA